jgi:hypothetical protein
MLLFVLPASCVHAYAYRFEPGDVLGRAPAPETDAIEDDDLRASIRVDEDAIRFTLTNKTSELLQVRWGQITLDHGDKSQSVLTPDVDPGWLVPGATTTVHLVPLVLPRRGNAAERYADRRLELDIPTLVHYEPKIVRLRFVARVTPL